MKKKSAKKSATALSAMDVLLGSSPRLAASTSAITAQFKTVMSLAKTDLAQLMQQVPGLHITEARDLHARAQAMSVVIARQFRERRLTAAVPYANQPPTGIKGLVDGPTYTDMFNPDWANHCPPDAIEATTSPVAYLTDLYRFAKELEGKGKPGEVITLDARRPDLKDLVLDHTALNRVEPTIVLVNEILEKSIRSHLDGISLPNLSVDDATLQARYPNVLPFERYTSQINYALGRKDRTLGDAIRAADPAYPYFKEPGVHSLLSDTALIQFTGFGPVQQGLLLEAPYFPDPDAAAHSLSAGRWRIDPRTRLMTKTGDTAEAEQSLPFFQDNFGVGSFIELQDTQTFCLRTGLKTEELEALLSVGAFAPSRSPNVLGEGEVDGSLSGSVYINAGKSPAMGIETLPAVAGEGTMAGPRHRITHSSPDRFDRMNRMIRLARWLELSFDEVDQILVSVLQAEQNAAVATRRVTASVESPWLITQNTLRALGLLKLARQRHALPAEDFAALVYGLSEYGRGKTPSQFDRMFNSQALFSIPLVLDDQPFTAMPATEAERQKIDHLCAALGMTYEVFLFAFRVIEQTYGGQPLRWSREVVSAFYRLAKLPRYLGLSTVEALALLEVLDASGSQLVSKLAGVTQIATYYALGNTDTLSVIHALVDCSAWLQDNNWSVAQLCRLVLPPTTQPVATDAELGLLQQMHTRLVSALITESSFTQVGAPDVLVTAQVDDEATPIYVIQPLNWFELLSEFVNTGEPQESAKGLVHYIKGETEEWFEEWLSDRVDSVLHSLGIAVDELGPKITNMIMRARGAQEALLMEGLASYLTISADLAKALLTWTQGNRHQLLSEVQKVANGGDALKVDIGDEVLVVLDALTKRATLAIQLGLSPTLIKRLVAQPEWFGLADASLTLQLIYFTTQYASILRLSDQDEETLLDYLRLINTRWEGATEGDKKLIRDSAAHKLGIFLNWGVREVLAVALHLNEDGVIFTLKDLNTAVKICMLSRHSGLDANALLALHKLAPTSSTDHYRQAADLALSSITENHSVGTGEVGQAVSSVITVTPDYLVANRTEDKAEYIITLRDFLDEPMAGVSVRWSTDMGELGQAQTVTNENGVSSNTLAVGTVMGIAHVAVSYGLEETLRAPNVTIDCDEETIGFIRGQRNPATAMSNKLEAILYTVTLVDQFGNRAIDRVVEWGTTLGEFQRYQTYSDANGVAVGELRSRSGGAAEVVVNYNNGNSFEFAPVEFVSFPYFQYVKFLAPVFKGEEVTVECSLVELDGTPRADEPITWSADLDELLAAPSVTNAQGIATVQFRAEDVGVVIITASASSIQSKSSLPTIVSPVVEVVDHFLSHDEFMLGTLIPITFSVTLKKAGAVANRVAVDWSVNTGNAVRSYSDQTGIATFSTGFSLVGTQTITAQIFGTNNSHAFKVLVHYPDVLDKEADGEKFILGRSAPITFSVWLGRDAVVAPQSLVNWLTSEGNSDKVYSDADGKATFISAFEEVGEQTVTATVDKANNPVGFDVLVVLPQIWRQESSAKEFILISSDPVFFSVWLGSAEEPISSMLVEWSISGGEPFESTSDANGKAIFQTLFDQLGSQVVTAKVKDLDSSTTFDVLVSELIIDRYRASDEVYFIGDSPPILYEVWVNKNGHAAAQIAIEWTMSDGPVTQSFTDNDGKASFSTGFSSKGVKTVTAKIVGLARSYVFSVDVKYLPVFDVVVEEPEFTFPKSADFLVRGEMCTLVVKLLDENKKSIAGMPFSFNYIVLNPSLVNVSVPRFGEYFSAVEGVRFSINVADKGRTGDFDLRLSGAGGRMLRWERQYRVGFVYRPATFSVNLFLSTQTTWTPYFAAAEYVRPPSTLGMLKVSVPSRQWDATKDVSMSLGFPSLSTGLNSGSQLRSHDIVVVPGLSTVGGYVILLPGELSVP